VFRASSARAAILRKRGCALILAGAVALVAILASRPDVRIADWLPAKAQIGAAGQQSSSPADKVQSSTLTDVGYATFPSINILIPPGPTELPLWWTLADGRRQGHRHRVDRPPRLDT
jgi:hypothetical protein